MKVSIPARALSRAVVMLLVLLIPRGAFASAGRPLNTDDATVANPRSCQVENWVQHARGDSQLWILPACNIGGFEATLGTTMDWPQGEASDSSSLVMQGKFLGPNPAFVAESRARYGLVFGADYTHEAHGGRRDWQMLSAYVPVTVNLTHADQVHVNLGYTRDRFAGTGDGTYGLAGSHDVNRHVTLMGEVFGSFRTAPSAQAAVQTTFGDFQFDASFGRPVNRSWRDAIFSIGIEWYPQALW